MAEEEEKTDWEKAQMHINQRARYYWIIAEKEEKAEKEQMQVYQSAW